jgi:hypothetical protein
VIGRDDVSTDYTGCRGAAQEPHVLHEAGELGQLLDDPRRGHECSPPAFDLDEALTHEVLNRRSNRGPADAELTDQFLFRGELRSDRERTAGNTLCEDIFDLGVKRQSR